MMFFSTSNPLRWKLATVIVLKILFLCIFWQMVLKYEATHVNIDSMTDRLLSPIPLK